jgi:glyoxylase-like metal-dependent hydrolase (beta-lactamase superfamily II)
VTDVEFTIVNIGTLSINKFWDETERQREPSATCTLLEAGGRRLLVDPSPAPELLEPMLFARLGIRPGDIDLVFLTHFHGDHLFGIEMFDGKPWLMAEAGLDEWRPGGAAETSLKERFLPAQDQLPDGVSLVPGPGHTFGLHCLGADTEWGRLIVAGDAVMTRDFFDAEDGFHNSVDFDQVGKTIRMIKTVADVVVPGHGNLILNKRETR